MREVKSGEYLIVSSTGPQDRYLFTRNLGNDVACIIRVSGNDKTALARQVSEESFAALWQDLITHSKPTLSRRSLEFHVIFIGGNNYDEPNSPAYPYVSKLLSYMLFDLLHLTGKEDIPGNNKPYAFENNGLRINFKPLLLGETPHDDSLLINSISDVFWRDYNQWERERHFGCSTEEDKRKSVEFYIEREWQSHLRAVQSMDKHEVEFLARLKQRREARLSAATLTQIGGKRSAAMLEEKNSKSESSIAEPSTFKEIFASPQTAPKETTTFEPINKKQHVRDSNNTTDIPIITKG